MSEQNQEKAKIQEAAETAKEQGFQPMLIHLGPNKTAYVYRGLTRQEWRQLVKEQPINEQNMLGAKEELEEKIVRLAVIHPVMTDQAVSTIPGGIISSLSDLIMQASGFGPIEEEPTAL